jgi:hypothetical protein
LQSCILQPLLIFTIPGLEQGLQNAALQKDKTKESTGVIEA